MPQIARSCGWPGTLSAAAAQVHSFFAVRSLKISNQNPWHCVLCPTVLLKMSCPQMVVNTWFFACLNFMMQARQCLLAGNLDVESYLLNQQTFKMAWNMYLCWVPSTLMTNWDVIPTSPFNSDVFLMFFCSCLSWLQRPIFCRWLVKNLIFGFPLLDECTYVTLVAQSRTSREPEYQRWYGVCNRCYIYIYIFTRTTRSNTFWVRQK